jgi:hypothetical protein
LTVPGGSPRVYGTKTTVAVATLALAVPACSRTGLDIDKAGLQDASGTALGDAAACEVDAHAGAIARAPASPQITRGTVVDPDDDLLLVAGGLSADGVWAMDMSAISLATGASTPLTLTGDTQISLGPNEVAAWDAANHRAIVLGGGFFEIPSSDASQVFAVRVSGSAAQISKLPDFPGGTTGDLPLAATYDPVAGRLLAIPESANNTHGVQTYALDLTEGSERWLLLNTDPQPALTNFEFYTAGYDPGRRRMLAVGYDFPSGPPSMWALSLDAPSGWTAVPGAIPPEVAATFFPIVWDPLMCAFLTAVAGPTCLYEAWKIDVGESFTFSSLGIATQPTPRFARVAAGFDAARHNFVFGSAFDCFGDHEAPASSTDFFSVIP